MTQKSAIKRYDEVCGYDAGMGEIEEGEYVRFEDHNAVLSESENIARIMADAADANGRSAEYERQEHAKTAAVLRLILSESASYLQTKTRKEAMDRVSVTGNCVCLPNRLIDRQPTDPVSAAGAPTKE